MLKNKIKEDSFPIISSIILKVSIWYDYYCIT